MENLMMIACPAFFEPDPFFWWMVGLLAAPACHAVEHMVTRRFAPLLGRGAIERCVVLMAALTGALSMVAHAAIAALVLADRGNASGVADALLVFVAPAPLGAIPWAAGELVGPESARRGLALISAIIAAYAITLGGCSILRLTYVWRPEHAAAVMPLAALSAALAYIAVRGKALEPAPPEAVALDRVFSTIIPAR